MTYWDGKRWVADAPATDPSPRRRSRLLGATTEAGLITLLTFGLIAGSALAAKPSSATLSVTPNHASAWSSATATGCGYSGTEVYLDIHKPAALAFTAAAPDANGCISVTFTTDGPGTYLLETRQKGSGKHWRVLASYELAVL